MNIPKKQKKIPTWLPTTVSLLAIVAIILLIYIGVTFINSSTADTQPSATPTPTLSPTPTVDPDEELSKLPVVIEDSQSTYYATISDYLTETVGEDFVKDSLSLSKKHTPKDNTTLYYAKYKVNDTYEVSELLLSDTITPAASEPSLSKFLLLSRSSSDVATIYIQALISNFYSFRNNEDADSLAQLLSTESQEDAEKITARMEYIDFITVTNLSINPIISATVDYVIFASEQTTLLGIATPAPGLSELLVTMDSDYYPHIFIGNTDKKADEARDFLKNTSSFKKLHDTVENALITALDSDPALKAAYENLISR